MKTTLPPAWLERTLRLCLSARDRDTISGDLLEIYRDEKLPAQGRWRANAWYLSQVFSLLPRTLLTHAPLRPALGLFCAFTALCGLWLGFMDVYLGHANIAGHEAIAGTIVAQAIVTLLGLRARRIPGLRPLVCLGCLALLWLAGVALHGLLTGADFEGYILLIALALVVQVALTVLTLLQDRRLAMA